MGMKHVLVEICQRARERRLPFLLVGGNAVILLGIPRFTRDIDIMITDEHRDAWRQLIFDLGYRSYHAIDAFEQFEPAGAAADLGPAPGIDLMLVGRSTWEKLYPAAQQVDLDQGETVQIPSALHFIAMKLNASRNPNRRAGASDLGDVISLVRACQIDTLDPGFQAILERYGSAEDIAAIHKTFPEHD